MKQQVQTLAHQRRRTHKQARARCTRPRRLHARRHYQTQAHQAAERAHLTGQQPYDATVPAPAILSFVEEPDQVLDFIQRLRAACQPGKRVILDLRLVQTLTQCTILLLKAKLLDDDTFARDAHIFVRPSQCRVTAGIWRQAFRAPTKADSLHPLSRALVLGRNPLRHKQVEVELADMLVQRAMHHLTGTPQDHKAAYRTLTECMSNTFKHADPTTEATENWWLASYPHPGPGPQRWCFAFIDNGVGILESLVLKGVFQRLRQKLGLLSRHQTLQMLLEGKVGSRLGFSYRGKGLPGIYKELERNRIQNLVIIANDTRANLATKEYVTLPHPLGGTFLYWEVSLPPQSLII